ncbi:hypothetical protein GQ44DRAFT_713493, partial [Phaeosphaeriaceae sp. PMI808]
MALTAHELTQSQLVDELFKDGQSKASLTINLLWVASTILEPLLPLTLSRFVRSYTSWLISKLDNNGMDSCYYGQYTSSNGDYGHLRRHHVMVMM